MKKILLACMFFVSIVLAACGNESASTDTTKKDLTKVKLVTNWFAQPEHGGQYAAVEKGFYKDKGLDVTIQSGGPQVSAVQIVAAGQAQFGMAQGDELLMARDQGIPIVAIAAIFQKDPQAIMVHKGTEKTMADLNGHDVYISSGSAYWEYLKKNYNLDKVKELKYTGSLSGFVGNPTAAIQSYATSEPYDMKQQNVDIDQLLIADTGYNPYANVLFTTEKYVKEHPNEVKAFVEASMKGWTYYKDNYAEINPVLQKQNKDLTLDKMEFSAKALVPYVFDGDAKTNGVGYMSKDRWETLAKQLKDLNLIKEMPDVSKVYTSEYIQK